jgi:hypothetical protein
MQFLRLTGWQAKQEARKMIYEGTLHVGIDDNAKIEKQYGVIYFKWISSIRKDRTFGNGLYKTAEEALAEIKETDTDFDEANVMEYITADKLLITLHILKTAYKSEAEVKKWK